MLSIQINLTTRYTISLHKKGSLYYITIVKSVQSSKKNRVKDAISTLVIVNFAGMVVDCFDNYWRYNCHAVQSLPKLGRGIGNI